MIPPAPPQTVDVPAHLGWRLLAQLVDLTIVVFVFGIVIGVYSASGVDVEREMDHGSLIEITFFALVFCYFLIFEGLLSATPGKMAAGLRVTMRDGSRVTGWGAVLRNLVRIPELMFWYIPSVISVAASPERRRLGDFAGRTMVWRRGPAPQGAQLGPAWPMGTPGGAQGSAWPGPPAWPVPQGWQGQPAQAQPGWRTAQPRPDWQTVQTQPGAQTTQPGWPTAQTQPAPLVDWATLAAEGCATAARGLANAENAYRLMAEREHLRLVQFGLTEPGTDDLSDEYVSAWDAFAEAVVGVQQSYHRLIEVLAGGDVWGFITSHPPLATALRAVEEYLPAASDEDVVAVFRRRLEGRQTPGI